MIMILKIIKFKNPLNKIIKVPAQHMAYNFTFTTTLPVTVQVPVVFLAVYFATL